MAGELQYYGDTASDSGLTITAKIYNSSGVQQGSDVACSEVGSLAIYIGDAPALSAGSYVVRFFDASALKGQGVLYWDGTAEIDDISINADIDGIPTVAEFEARTLPSADYFVVSDYTAPDNASIAAILTDTATTIPAQITALNNLAIADVETALSNYGASTFDGNLSGLSTHSAADVWAVATRTITGLPDVTVGGYATGQGPSDLIDLSNLDVAVSSRLATAGYTAPDNASITAILTDTGTTIPAQITALNNLAIADVETALGNYGAPVYSTLQTYGDANWATATGFSTLDSAAVQAAAAAALAAYNPPTRAELTTDTNSVLAAISALPAPSDATLANQTAILSAVGAARAAAEAVADGRHAINYEAGTATQYNTDGTARTVFDLFQADGTTAATSASNAVERRPQ